MVEKNGNTPQNDLQIHHNPIKIPFFLCRNWWVDPKIQMEL